MMKNYKVVMLFGYVELYFEMQGEEHHKRKIEYFTDSQFYQEDAEEKYHRNQLLAFNAREAIK